MSDDDNAWGAAKQDKFYGQPEWVSAPVRWAARSSAFKLAYLEYFW